MDIAALGSNKFSQKGNKLMESGAKWKLRTRNPIFAISVFFAVKFRTGATTELSQITSSVKFLLTRCGIPAYLHVFYVQLITYERLCRA